MKRDLLSRRELLVLFGFAGASALVAGTAIVATPNVATTPTAEAATATAPAVSATESMTATGTATAISGTAENVTPQIVAATKSFLETLSDSEKEAVLFDWSDSEQKQRWSNLPEGLYQRDGIMWGDMSEAQQNAWLAVMQATLSSEGYKRVVAEWNADDALAAVLIVIGILLFRSRSLVESVGGFGGRWSRALPLCSALIVTVLGAGIVLSGLVTYIGRS